jgi:hypothetical protein
VCPVCGSRVEPYKTWQLVSPFPDSKGRITVTVMGSFTCPQCGHKWRAVVTKLKVGGEDVELETPSGSKKLSKTEKKGKREGAVFEIDIEE